MDSTVVEVAASHSNYVSQPEIVDVGTKKKAKQKPAKSGVMRRWIRPR